MKFPMRSIEAFDQREYRFKELLQVITGNEVLEVMVGDDRDADLDTMRGLIRDRGCLSPNTLFSQKIPGCKVTMLMLEVEP